MLGDRVAGHIFEGVGSDQRCVLEGCGGRWWTEIMHCDRSHLGKPNFAHSGDLNEAELTQIEHKKQHELRFWDAVEAAAG
jgi:hypothetical protein